MSMNQLRSEGTEQENVISWCFHHERLYPDLKWYLSFRYSFG